MQPERVPNIILIENRLLNRDRDLHRPLIRVRLLTLRASAGKKKLTAAHRMYLHRARGKSIIRILDDEGRTVLPSMIGRSVENYPSLDQEVVRALLVEQSRTDHEIANGVARE